MSVRGFKLSCLRLGLVSAVFSVGLAEAALSPLPHMAELSRQATPRAAAEVARIRDIARRSPPAPGRQGAIVRSLRAVGPGGRAALAELVLAQAATSGSDRSAERAREALVAGALEALAVTPDQPAAELASAVLSSSEGSRSVLGAAALVLGRRATDEDLDRLISLSAGPVDATHAGLLGEAAVAGLGRARVPRAMHHLAGRIAVGDAALARLAEAAAFAGSSWAWAALGPARAEEGRALRSELVAALLVAWPTALPEARPFVERALEVIDARDAEARLAALPMSGIPTNAAQRGLRESLQARLRRAQARTARAE